MPLPARATHHHRRQVDYAVPRGGAGRPDRSRTAGPARPANGQRQGPFCTVEDVRVPACRPGWSSYLCGGDCDARKKQSRRKGKTQTLRHSSTMHESNHPWSLLPRSSVWSRGKRKTSRRHAGLLVVRPCHFRWLLPSLSAASDGIGGDACIPAAVRPPQQRKRRP